MSRRAVVLALAVAACTDARTVIDKNATGIEVVTQIDASRAVTQLRISGRASGTDAFAPGRVPDTPRPLAGEQTAVILLPDSLDGAAIDVRVDGLSGGVVSTSGLAPVTVRAHTVTRVEVGLGPPAVCGDGMLVSPIETCDDGNTSPGDGCAADCTVEPGWDCVNPAASPSRCSRHTTFDVASAASISNTRIAVSFDAAPDATQATVLSHYSVPGLTLTDTPILAGNTVTLVTSPQAATTYTVTVTGVTRASDAEPLTGAAASFTGRGAFDVASAASIQSTRLNVTFDAPPDPVQAVVLANYSVAGLALSGTPVLSGNTVTITTAQQAAIGYTVAVANVTRASDGEPLTIAGAPFTGRAPFDVASAASPDMTTVTVTFDAAPNPAQAVVLANYAIAGLTLTGTPSLSGNTVTLTTSAQAASTYTVTVANVTRASDAEPLTATTASFTGAAGFDVAAASSLTNRQITVTFNAPPNAAQATNVANYTIPGLTLSGTPTLVNSTVTLTTSSQSAVTYTVTVSNVTRASDARALTTHAASFAGRTAFDVTGAAAVDGITIQVTFDAPPNTAQATTLANYSVPGLTLAGTPTLVNNTVTLTTSPQTGATYTVTASNVTRASDAEPLAIASASFAGKAVLAPTVTNVQVLSTIPDNGSVPYNTGTATVRITGTQLATVMCPAGVRLDDRDGAGAAVGTTATTCTVDSDTQITATFPAGIRTRGATGWNVIVTNAVGSNTTSTQQLVPLAGLLVSEVYTGSSNGADHEFIEVFNATTTQLNASSSGLGLNVHVRDAQGADTTAPLSFVSNAVVPAKTFMLLVSSASTSSDPWFMSRDATYPAALGDDGDVYLSLSSTAQARVLDKLGWGLQPAAGVEGNALGNIDPDTSGQRRQAGGTTLTDTDDNSADFNTPSMQLSPMGVIDGPI